MAGLAPGPEGRAYARPFFCARFVTTASLNAKTHRHLHDPDHRRRSYRDRPGLRVRLFRAPRPCKTLKEEGYRIVLVNSNPATIMTDPELADATYIEPITPEIVAKIIEKERNDRSRRLCAAADHGRPDRAQLRAVAAPAWARWRSSTSR